MPDYHARPYEGVRDLPLLIALAQASGRPPQPRYYHPGDFVWQLCIFDATEDVRLWLDGDEAVACAIFEPPLTFQFVIHPAAVERHVLTAEVLQWVEGRRALVKAKDAIPIAYRELGNETLSTTALDSDAERNDLLTRAGYVRRGPAGVRFARVLDGPLPEGVLPDGARFCSVTDDEVEARAELHRDAWSVWGPSAYSGARYQRLREAPLYEAGLDIVLAYEDRFVSYCVCWLDTDNGVGYFEPVGTHSAAARRGFGRGVIREGMRRLRERGMR
ncbi:MAG TPA: GNAT family N-acetyltransferase, partial [Dehalococcoidia bacterium]